MNERQLQRQVAQYFAAVLDPAKVLYLHIPNEGKRGRLAQVDFKLGGGLPGAADWLLSWKACARGPIEETLVLWIELKVGKGRLSRAQEAFAKRVHGLGHLYVVCRDLDAVALALESWMVPRRPHKMLPAGNGWQLRGEASL